KYNTIYIHDVLMRDGITADKLLMPIDLARLDQDDVSDYLCYFPSLSGFCNLKLDDIMKHLTFTLAQHHIAHAKLMQYLRFTFIYQLYPADRQLMNIPWNSTHHKFSVSLDLTHSTFQYLERLLQYNRWHHYIPSSHGTLVKHKDVVSHPNVIAKLTQ